jgi:hypothetical protein
MSQSVRSHGNIFHQRKTSLTSICPPTNDIRTEKSNKRNSFTLRTGSPKKPWFQKIFDMPAIQLVGWTYVLICFCLSTIHLVNSFALLDPSSTKGKSSLGVWGGGGKAGAAKNLASFLNNSDSGTKDRLG